MSGSIVYIVDDEDVIRDSLSVLLSTHGYECRTFADGREFLDSYDDEHSGCLLLDMRMNGLQGLDVQAELNDRHFDIPVIFITAHADVPMAVTSLQAGAVDLIQKPFNGEQLLERVQEAIELDIARRQQQTGQKEFARRLEQLTPREREVLEMITIGKATKEIAASLGTTYNTVSNQRTEIMKKMQAVSATDLVRMVTLRSVE